MIPDSCTAILFADAVIRPSIMRVVVLFVWLIGFSGALHSANINIGPNGCTLDDAIVAANTNAPVGNCAAGSGTDVIIAPDGWVVTLNATLPNIVSDMTLRSATASGVFYILGDNERRVLRITGSNTDVTLLRVQVGGGKTSAVQGDGAGIRIENANVRLEDSFVVSNESALAQGSGIYISGGTLTLDRTEVLANDLGSGIYALNASVQVIDSLFAHNEKGGIGLSNSDLHVEGSLFDEANFGVGGAQSTVAFVNTTFTNTIPLSNSFRTAFSLSDFSSVSLNHVTSGLKFTLTDSMLSATNSLLFSCELSTSPVVLNTGNLYQSLFPGQPSNCLGQAPTSYYLLPIADNGGPTRTRAIGNPESLAIGAGNPTYCEPLDQRGQARGPSCDVGAYEATGFADVAVNASIDPGAPYVSNQQILLVVELENLGPGPATHVRFDIDATNAFVSSANSVFCNTIPCVITSIQPGQTLVIPVALSLSTFTSGSFSMDLSAHTTASSTYEDADEDNPAGNNVLNLSGLINQGADLSLVLNKLTNGPHFAGQTIQYQANIQNLGPQTATGTQLQFTPTNLGSIAFTGCSSSAGSTCNIANIGSGGSRVVTIQGIVTGNQFDAAGSVSATQVDINSNNNVDNWNNGGGVTMSDISVVATLLESGSIYSDRYLQFEIRIATGSQAASNIRLDYDFPGAGLIDIQQCFTFPCVIPTLAANSQLTLLAQFYAPIAVPGVIDTMSFGVRVTPGQEDPNLSNNESILLRPLIPAADMAAQLTRVTAPPFYSGQEIQYALRVANAGVNAATAVNVSMNPQNLTLLSAFGDLCPTVNCTISRLNAFDEENITLIYQINDVGAFNLIASANANELDNVITNNTDSTNNGGTAIAAPLGSGIFANGFE